MCAGSEISILSSVNGTSGHEIPRIRDFTYPWAADATLLMYSDGLGHRQRVSTRARPWRTHDPSLIAGVLYRDFGRGNDDSTIVVARTE